MPLHKRIERDGCTMENLHYACLVGFLALKAGVATVDEILGDYGLVHELVHWQYIENDDAAILQHAPQTADVVELARRIEQAIPCWPMA